MFLRFSISVWEEVVLLPPELHLRPTCYFFETPDAARELDHSELELTLGGRKWPGEKMDEKPKETLMDNELTEYEELEPWETLLVRQHFPTPPLK